MHCLVARHNLMRAREVNRLIEKLGGVLVRQVGSHRRYRGRADPDGGEEDEQGVEASTTVPQHRGDIPLGTLRAIERDMEPVFGKGWLRQ